ncbi:hypothetical protein TRIUR3_13865 [Triticum urartu]|uniref:Uncharacterized protein n=1 Tax=Triticum urartu TaxID=4572 RepID=M7Z298_TRIUA|nr:hypothetical protein TRIUR3_13865 [Triticum urartu]
MGQGPPEEGEPASLLPYLIAHQISLNIARGFTSDDVGSGGLLCTFVFHKFSPWTPTYLKYVSYQFDVGSHAGSDDACHGPSGCGKTTLLLALVGKLNKDLKFVHDNFGEKALQVGPLEWEVASPVATWIIEESGEEGGTLVNCPGALAMAASQSGLGRTLETVDIGLAMGMSGTEVAKESSNIIILDDDFTSVVKIFVKKDNRSQQSCWEFFYRMYKVIWFVHGGVTEQKESLIEHAFDFYANLDLIAHQRPSPVFYGVLIPDLVVHLTFSFFVDNKVVADEPQVDGYFHCFRFCFGSNCVYGILAFLGEAVMNILADLWIYHCMRW